MLNTTKTLTPLAIVRLTIANCLLFFAYCLLLIANCLLPIASFAQSNRIWSTYYGGSGTDWAGSSTTDASGNVYMAGASNSSDSIASPNGFQTMNNGMDAFLVKFDSVGTRLWATYYGGADDDWGYGVATDAFGNVYLAGITESASGIASGGFQNVFGGASDAFLVKFNASGIRLWATYYGETEADEGIGVATDAFGNVYLAGITGSAFGIASGGFQNTFGGASDAFLVKFDAQGTRLWSTYYGGTAIDHGWGIATDISGNVYLSGDTRSTSGIASSGFQNTFGGGNNVGDAFLVKFDAQGTRLWSTYYGGVGGDVGYGVASDPSGNVYLAGQTGSTSGIASGGFQNAYGGGVDAFLVKFNSFGIRLWATYYGGADTDYAYSVATDIVGNAYMAGDSYSGSIASGGFQNIHKGSEDLFVVMFNPNGARFCATYFGSGHDESGYATVDKFGNGYLTGYAKSPTDIDFSGFQSTFGGKYDALLVKFTACDTTLFTTNIITNNIYCNDSCSGTAMAITTGGMVPYTYSWDPNVVGQATQTATQLCSGTYTATVKDAANNTNTIAFTITQPPALTITANSTPAGCIADTGTATVISSGGTPGYTYVWNTGENSDTITSLAAGTYTVAVTDANGCAQIQTITVSQVPGITVTIGASATSITHGETTQLFLLTGVGVYLWSPVAGLSCVTCASPRATPKKTTTYCLWAVDANNCADSACITINVINCANLFVPSAFSPNNDNVNDVLYLQNDCIKELDFKIYDRWGNMVFKTANVNEGWDGTYKGEVMDPAVFVYYVNAVLLSGGTLNSKGNISLIK